MQGDDDGHPPAPSLGTVLWLFIPSSETTPPSPSVASEEAHAGEGQCPSSPTPHPWQVWSGVFCVPDSFSASQGYSGNLCLSGDRHKARVSGSRWRFTLDVGAPSLSRGLPLRSHRHAEHTSGFLHVSGHGNMRDLLEAQSRSVGVSTPGANLSR